MIYTYAYRIDEEHSPEGLVAIAQNYRTQCDIMTNEQSEWMFIRFEGEFLDDIADLFDEEAAKAGYEPGMFMEDYGENNEDTLCMRIRN